MAECDMCDGTGKMQTYKTADGHQVYGTTAANAAEVEAKYIDNGLKDGSVVLVDVSCNTCKGSGILPVYLEPAYWRGRSDAADDELDRAFFGLGKYIRKAIDRSE